AAAGGGLMAIGCGHPGRLPVMPTVITGLGETGPGRPEPGGSALIEVGPALPVLRGPGHHGAAGGGAGVGGENSQRRGGGGAGGAQGIRAGAFVTGDPPADAFDGSLGRLRAIPASRLAGQLLRPVSRSRGARAALHWSRSREPAVAAVVEALVLRPEEAAADF